MVDTAQQPVEEQDKYNKVWLSKIIRKNQSSKNLYDNLVARAVLSPVIRSDVKDAYCAMLCNFTRMIEREFNILYINSDSHFFDEKTIINGQPVNNTFGYKVFIEILNSLEKSFLIERFRGYGNADSDKNSCGYLTLTQDFRDIIGSCIKPRNGKSEVKQSSLVITDGQSGKHKIFGRGTKTMSHELVIRMQHYNRFLSNHDIRIGGIKVTPWLCRIFKDNLESHGRLYNIGEHLNYQTLASSERCTIEIDGQKTVELDYKHLHPSLLYHDVGEKIEGDVYQVDIDYSEIFEEDISTTTTYSFQLRNIVKGCMLRMLNTDSRESCIKSIEKMFKENIQAFPDLKTDHRTVAKKIMQAIEDAHIKIKHCFYVQHSLALMYFDSTILSIVLSRCLDEGIVALPVHDSVIVQEEHAGRTEELMRIGYAEFMGSPLNCIVERK